MSRRRPLAVALVVTAALAGCSSPGGGGGVGGGAAGGPGAAAAPGTTLAPNAFALYDAACAKKLDNHVVGLVKPDDLDEISGVVVSRQNPSVLWVHDDSGGQPDAYALAPSGELLGTFPLQGATNVDWEDIALGPGPTPGDHLYLGDIGDNDANRPNVAVYRAPEPKVTPAAAGTTGPALPAEKFTITYPDGPHDAETLLVDPLTGDLYIVTKEMTRESVVFMVPVAALVDGATITPTQVATLARGDTAASGLFSLVTGGDISPDGTVITIRTYSAVLVYKRSPGESVAQALSEPPCDGNAAIEIQGEGVGIAPDGRSYYTISEGQNAPINQDVITP
jgi:hypothetical protein